MNDTQVLTLTDFLLARIAEDERGSPGVVQTRRDLTEVRAKRALVNLHRVHWLPEGECDACGDRFPCPTLAALAIAYADHPDYREEWKP